MIVPERHYLLARSLICRIMRYMWKFFYAKNFKTCILMHIHVGVASASLCKDFSKIVITSNKCVISKAFLSDLTVGFPWNSKHASTVWCMNTYTFLIFKLYRLTYIIYFMRWLSGSMIKQKLDSFFSINMCIYSLYRLMTAHPPLPNYIPSIYTLSLFLRERKSSKGYPLSMIYQFIAGLNASSPTEARQRSPSMRKESKTHNRVRDSHLLC